jgi:hypothetical protein
VVAIVATYDAALFVDDMEYGGHRFVVGDAFRVVAMYDAAELVRQCHGTFLDDLVVAYDDQRDVRRDDG